MKKIFFALAILCTTTMVHADTDSFGTVGIEKIPVTQDTANTIKITPTFFNISEKDQAVILEVSITDNYSQQQVMNVDKLTSDILDTTLILPKQVHTYSKTYSYTVPVIPKKSTYKVELRILDKNRNTLYVAQSGVITLGSDNAPTLSAFTLNTWFEYDGKKYALHEGPVIKSDKKDTAFYVIEAHNTGTEAIALATEYSSRKYAALGAVFTKNDDIPVGGTIAKKSKGIIKVPAKYFEENGTFEGKVNIYADQAGKKGLIRTEGFRYMIGDSFIVVTDATISTTTLVLDVSKTIFDSTQDLTEDVLNSATATAAINEADGKMYTFTISYKDKNNTEVASQTSNITWADIVPEVSLPITLTNKERTIIEQVEISITDAAGKSMFRNAFAVTPMIVDSMSIKDIGIITTLILCIVSMIGYLITRRKSWLVLILIFLAAIFFIKYSNVTATSAIDSGNYSMSGFTNGSGYSTKHRCYAHGYRGLTMQSTSFPGPTAEFRCGEKVSFKLDPINRTCGNNPATTYFIITSTTGLTVDGAVSGTLFPNNYVTVAIRGGESYPITVTINPGFSGNASLRGYYAQKNGACSDKTGEVVFRFNNVTCAKTCSCEGRTNVCREGANPEERTPNATECRLTASCGVSVSGNQATFTTSATRALGTLSYKDTDSGAVITNPITRTIPSGQSITQNTTVFDAFDGVTAQSSCTAGGTVSSNPNTCEATNSCPPTTVVTQDIIPSISDLVSTPSIVPQGQDCKFSWSTQNMLLCSFKVNGTDITPGDGKTGSNVSISTLDGNNKLGLLTCVSSTTPQRIISASTTCRVNPEVRQQ